MSVAVPASVADLKDGHPRAEKSAEMKYRPQRDADDPEWDHCRRMAVHDCAHFGVGFVDFAMKKRAIRAIQRRVNLSRTRQKCVDFMAWFNR
jgi:hypothetical protein